MVSYRHWSVLLWWDPNDVPHRRILRSYEAERWSVPASLCWWCCYCLADQLWVLIAYARRRRVELITDRQCGNLQWQAMWKAVIFALMRYSYIVPVELKCCKWMLIRRLTYYAFDSQVLAILSFLWNFSSFLNITNINLSGYSSCFLILTSSTRCPMHYHHLIFIAVMGPRQ